MKCVRAAAPVLCVSAVIAVLVTACMLSSPVLAGAGPIPDHFTKLVTSDSVAEDAFGYSVAVSGDTAVVGIAGYYSGEGAAYVYTRSGSNWTQTQKLAPSDGATSDFGYSVAISGDTLVVGGPGGALGNGAAYVYTRSGTTWSEQQRLVADDGALNDLFGWSVAIDSDTIAVGAIWDDDTAGLGGSAYVFTRSGTTWTQAAKLLDSGGAAEDYFGNAIAISGSTVVVGVASADDSTFVDSGAVCAFVKDGAAWPLQQKMVNPEPADYDYFGASVAVSGDTVLTGAYYKEDYGAAYAYTRTGTTWSLQQKLTDPAGLLGGWFGYSVALNGDVAVVGSPEYSTDPPSPGRATVFSRTGDTWVKTQSLAPLAGEEDDQYGSAVGFDGVSAVIGAPGDDDVDDGSGAAYVHSVPSMPVWRFYNKRVGSHFYTPNEAEKNYVITTWPTIYTYEGVAYTVYPPKNTQPLYRFYNKKIGSHFYTASVAERDSVIANLSAIYSYDGPTYKVSTAAATGKPPVYRFYNKRNGSHFYTASESEKASVIANLSGTYTFEGTAFWLGQ